MTESRQSFSSMLPAASQVAVSRVQTPEDLRGPAGRLEALYTAGAIGATHAAIVCHPHPLFGGTMHNKVVYHAAKALQQAGMPVLRFNFRGAGASEGVHDRGVGEQEDLLAAMAWLRRETRLPLIVAGFSFGAYVSLATCCAGRARQVPAELPLKLPIELPIGGLIALGLPIQAGDRGYSYEFLEGCSLRKLFVSGAADEFGPLAAVESVVATAAPPCELVWVPGADHFFQEVNPDSGGLQARGAGLAIMQAAVADWLGRYFPSDPARGGELCR